MGLCIAAASLFVYAEQQRVPVLGLVLGGFSVFVLCYVDRWRFICTAQLLNTRLIFFFPLPNDMFSDIEGTKSEQFTRGQTAFVKAVSCACVPEKKRPLLFSHL